MRNFLYIAIVAAIFVIPWQYSLYKERQAKNYAGEIERLYRDGAYDEALSRIHRMSRLYKDREQLLVAREVERKIDKAINRIESDSLENEKRLLLSQNRGMLDSIEQEIKIRQQAIKAIERREAEDAARCQCVTAMKNMRRPVHGRIDTLLCPVQ